VLSFSSPVWSGVKKEVGNNNTQNEWEKRFERKGGIFTIKIKGSIVMKREKWMRGAQGKFFFSHPTIYHHVDNRYRKSPPNTWDRRKSASCLPPVSVIVKEVLEVEWHNHPPWLYYVTSTVCVVFCLLVSLRCYLSCEGYTVASLWRAVRMQSLHIRPP
jgi:4-amino-4-deoxy-L-arabinose transferase-like glycosyltransferase